MRVSRELGEEKPDWIEAMIKTKSRRVVTLVAEFNREIVGFTIAYRKQRNAYIEKLAVREEYRGHGVGSTLLSTLEEMLRNTGIKGIYLSVKNWNTRALDFYLNRGYGVKGVVLIMGSNPREISAEHDSSYTISDLSASYVKKYTVKPLTWWSNLVDEVDLLVYKKFYREERALIVKKNRSIKAIATYTLNNTLSVDSLRVVSFNALEVLEEAICALRNIAHVYRASYIEIPVDASKRKLVTFLEEKGFNVREAEYLLSKEIDM